MNVFLLTVALAGPVEVPKPVMLVPPALVTAAVPSVRIAPEGNTAAESAAPEAQLPSGGSMNEAIAHAQAFPESSAAQSAKPGECRIGSATPIGEATPRKPGAMPEPKSDLGCTLIGIYAKKRMLSGPWSASRRLEAARIRGDEDEVKRMEAMLDDLLGKAIFEGEPNPTFHVRTKNPSNCWGFDLRSSLHCRFCSFGNVA